MNCTPGHITFDPSSSLLSISTDCPNFEESIDCKLQLNSYYGSYFLASGIRVAFSKDAARELEITSRTGFSVCLARRDPLYPARLTGVFLAVGPPTRTVICTWESDVVVVRIWPRDAS
jgi:hypothetical protein